MEQVYFVKRLQSILGGAQIQTNTIPVILKETFDRIIEEEIKRRIENNEKVYDNGMYLPAGLSVEKDYYNRNYAFYVNEKTDYLYIYETGIDNFVHDQSIGSNMIAADTKKLMEKFKEVFQEVKNGHYDAFQSKAEELFKSGQTEEYLKFMRSFLDEVEQMNNKTPEEYFKIMLDAYEKQMKEEEVVPEYDKNEKEPDKELHFDLSYEMPGEEKVVDGPRGEGKKPVKRNYYKEEDYNKRFDAIREMTGCTEYFTNKKGHYRGYDYDLSKNGTEESGYIIILEPENVDAKTYIIRMTLEDFERTRPIVEEEKQRRIAKMIEKGQDEKVIEAERQRKISDNEIKATFSRMVLKDKIGQAKELRHRAGHYEDYLKRIEYYLTGKKELAKQNYLIANRAELLKTNGEGER